MVTPAMWQFGERMRALDEATGKWRDHFLSKGRDYTEGFLAGFKEARSPFGRWFRKVILLEMDARKLGAEKALEELGK